ncbi:unnamed protein product, partial [Mesorhabditis belari]|uniref:Uncharacterized protein n=1 Tax=Mesorhabditis belari TaxID=2138241 RepID=A0AAF3FM29_9BILA
MEEKLFFVKCLLYALSCSGTIMLRSIFANLNFPLVRLFNKTSIEVLNIDDSGTLMMSICTTFIAISQVLMIALLIPIMAWKGEKFVCVQVKFILSIIGGVLLTLSWCLESAFPFLVGIFLVFSAASIVNVADTLFLTKIAPNKHKNFYGSLIVPATSLQFFLMMFLSRDDVFGNDKNWGWIIIISMLLCTLNLLIGSTLPNDFEKKSDQGLMKFTKSYTKHTRQLLEERDLRKTLYLLIISQLMFILCVSLIEATFIMPIYKREGMDQNSILTMKTITYFAALVPAFLGPFLINSLSKKTLAITFCLTNVVKSLGHMINGQLKSKLLCYCNSIIEGAVTSCGIVSLPLLLADELLPAEYVVAGSQTKSYLAEKTPLLIPPKPF